MERSATTLIAELSWNVAAKGDNLSPPHQLGIRVVPLHFLVKSLPLALLNLGFVAESAAWFAWFGPHGWRKKRENVLACVGDRYKRGVGCLMWELGS